MALGLAVHIPTSTKGSEHKIKPKASGKSRAPLTRCVALVTFDKSIKSTIGSDRIIVIILVIISAGQKKSNFKIRRVVVVIVLIMISHC